MSGIHITAYKNRTTKERITLTDVDGATVTLDSDDTVRVKVGRQGATPILDITSAAALSGGTSVTSANPCTVIFDQDDLNNKTAGVYDVEAMVVDTLDHNRVKHAEMGVFVLIETQGGSVN